MAPYIHARFAAAVAPTLNSRCDVTRQLAGAPDAHLGYTAGATVTVRSNVRCLVAAQQLPQESALNERLRGRTFATVFVEPGVPVAKDSVIVRGTETYQVIGDPIFGTNAALVAVPCARNT